MPLDTRPATRTLLSLSILLLAVGCGGDIKHDAQSGSDSLSWEATWKQGCFQVNGALLPPDTVTSEVPEKAADPDAPTPVHLRIAVIPDGACKELKGGSADIVTGFGTKPEEMDARVSTFDFGLQRNFWLSFSGSRQYPCLYHMERTYGMADGRTFLLSFQLGKAQREAARAGSGLELAFEIPVNGAGVAVLRWPASTASRVL